MKTADELRKTGRNRLQKYRDRKKLEGFKTYSFYLKNEHLDVINKLKEEKKLSSRDNALCYIIEYYKKIELVSSEALHETKSKYKRGVVSEEGFIKKETLHEMDLDDVIMIVAKLDKTAEKKAKILNELEIKTGTGNSFNASRFHDALRRAKRRKSK